ncbi:MAG TPA: hypothetical protein DC057_14405 [Spirochaetia bacterium]|nr:hypothetical protein [Spirochaetia bacterium]
MKKKVEMKLEEIAYRINKYLQEFEADKKVNTLKMKVTKYYQPSAFSTGKNIGIRYIIYQSVSILNKKDAIEYMNWLEKGNKGKHFEMKGY